MTGLYVSALLAVGAAAQEPPRERVRFIDGKSELCEAISADAEGVTLRLGGLPKPVTFRWWQLDPEDAAALRERFLGKAAAPAPETFAVAGVRLRTLDNKVVEGVLLPHAPPLELWVKNAEGKFVFRVDAVASREDVLLEPRKVYTPDEMLQVLVGRIRPGSPEDYDRLGAELLRARLRERAVAAFRTAELLRHPEWPEARLYRELVRLRDRLEGLALRKIVFDAQEACLAGDYDGALAQMDAVEKDLERARGEEVLREVRRLRAELQEFRGRARDDRIVREWRRAFEGFLKERALDRALSFAEARAFVEERLLAEVLEHVRRRFNFSPDDPAARLAWDRRGPELLAKHGYDEASWIVLRAEAGAPDAWWSGASDAARYRLLKGLAVEKHFRVLRAESKSCGTCGGTGLAESAVCPACAGLKHQRVLIYR